MALWLLAAGCAHGQAGRAIEEPVTVAGSLVYRARIAHPERALAIAELREAGASEDGAIVGEQGIELDGRQAPIPFKLTAAKARIDSSKDYAVRGRS